MKKEILRMEQVSYSEQGVVQLEDFNLRIFSGEIMGLLPINNYGLSAVLRLLQHNNHLDYGYVYYCGQQVNSWRTTKHKGNRIGLIQSESCLVESLTVADNIFVLRPGFRSWIINLHILRSQLVPFLNGIGIHISADAYIGDLSIFERTVVDVLKSVVAGCKLIVLRDISAHLCETELKKIHMLLRHYTTQGISFLYIDFHFEDLRQICDKVALMTGGRIIKVLGVDSSTLVTLRKYTKIYTEKVKGQMSKVREEAKDRQCVFSVNNLCGKTISNLNFFVQSGECVVLQNADNQIFAELLSILSGETSPLKGKIYIDNQPICKKNIRKMGIIQELPTKTMLFGEMDYLDNLCFNLDHRLPEVWSNARVRRGIRLEYSTILGDDVFDMRINQLSEIQKYELIYTRIKIQNPKVVFCVQPFRRADIEHRMRIWELIKVLLDRGIAVVILSVNLADSLSLADRLIRIHGDRTAKTYLREDFSEMSINAPWIDLYQEFRKNGSI